MSTTRKTNGTPASVPPRVSTTVVEPTAFEARGKTIDAPEPGDSTIEDDYLRRIGEIHAADERHVERRRAELKAFRAAPSATEEEQLERMARKAAAEIMKRDLAIERLRRELAIERRDAIERERMLVRRIERAEADERAWEAAAHEVVRRRAPARERALIDRLRADLNEAIELAQRARTVLT